MGERAEAYGARTLKADNEERGVTPLEILRPEPIYDEPSAPSDAGIGVPEGVYCPIPDRAVFMRRYHKDRYRLTQLGLERRCIDCKHFWPADTEFFYSGPPDQGGLVDYCKDCYLKRTGRSGGLRAKRKAPARVPVWPASFRIPA